MHETFHVYNKIFFEIEIMSLFQVAGRRNVLRERWRFCIRIEAQMTTRVSDCRIRGTPRGGFRTSKSRQLSTMKKPREERNEKRQRKPKGTKEVLRSDMLRTSTCVSSPCRNFRGLSLAPCFPSFWSSLETAFIFLAVFNTVGRMLVEFKNYRELKCSHFFLC